VNKTEDLEEEAELALLLAYHRQMRKSRYFGVVEMTYQDGEVKHRREIDSEPIAAMAARLMGEVPERYRAVLKAKYADHKSFGKDNGEAKA